MLCHSRRQDPGGNMYIYIYIILIYIYIYIYIYKYKISHTLSIYIYIYIYTLDSPPLGRSPPTGSGPASTRCSCSARTACRGPGYACVYIYPETLKGGEGTKGGLIACPKGRWFSLVCLSQIASTQKQQVQNNDSCVVVCVLNVVPNIYIYIYIHIHIHIYIYIYK